MNAWKGRRASYPIVWGTLVISAGFYLLISGMMPPCAMLWQGTQQLIRVNCT